MQKVVHKNHNLSDIVQNDQIWLIFRPSVYDIDAQTYPKRFLVHHVFLGASITKDENLQLNVQNSSIEI